MTEYTQILDEIFNILTMHLLIDRRQRSSFVMHFNSAAMIGGITNPAPGGPSKGDFNSDVENWFQLSCPDGSKFALISVYEFVPPIFHKQTDFDLLPLMMQFEKYFKAQEKARATVTRHQKNALDAELGSTPNEYFNNVN